MELHHKLRRDPSWHPSGCNICGQVSNERFVCVLLDPFACVGTLAIRQSSVIFCCL